MDAYRDQHHNCPRCNHELRVFGERLVCDHCEGLMLTEDDLRNAIVELTGLAPVFALRDEAPGKRACPRCSTAMTTAKLSIELEGEKPTKPGPELDRCAAHGLWFDESELADVLAPVAGKGPGGGMASTTSKQPGATGARSFTFNLGGRGWAS
jgi:Zn-finger nucleic acid-binding protein